MNNPIALKRGEAAYNAYYNQSPQIFFEDLATPMKMRWVNVARAVLELKPSNGYARAWTPERRKQQSEHAKKMNKIRWSKTNERRQDRKI